MADPRFKGLELKVGIFLLTAFSMLIIAIVMFGIQKKLFVPKYQVRIYSETGEGLSKGMPIKFSGFQIARVDSIQLEEEGVVVMTANVPKTYAKWIKQNSTAKLGSANFIGAASISFFGGTKEAPNLADNSEFYLDRDEGIQGLIDKATPVLEDAKAIVSHINTITERVADENGDVNRLMRGLGELGDDVSNKRGSLGYLARSDYVTNETKKIMTEVQQIVQNLNEISAHIASISNEIDKQLPPTLERVDNITMKLDATMDLTKPIAGNVEKITSDLAEGTDNITAMKREVEFMMETTKRLLLTLETKWPFSSGENVPENIELK